MWDLVLKIWFFIVILPLSIAEEGIDMFKKFMVKHGYTLDWPYVWLAVLVLLLIVVILLQYGYN